MRKLVIRLAIVCSFAIAGLVSTAARATPASALECITIPAIPPLIPNPILICI